MNRKLARRPPPRRKTTRANTKRSGELSEAAFLHKATSLGFAVARPWGDSERYDFILDVGNRLLRVQVKSTASLRARGYDVRAMYSYGDGRLVYTPEQVDFIVAHIAPRNIWYVVPARAIPACAVLRFYPDGARSPRFEQYREAWPLMNPALTASGSEGINTM
jgi:hypothetical protein